MSGGLARFVEAQDWVYDQVLAELQAGQKCTHWMWFIFPQMDGLGSSTTARYFAIKSLEEARAYLEHPLLGARLRECSRILLGLEGRSAAAIFGCPDDMKLKSSMTLFERASGNEPVFSGVLDKYYDGARDSRTLELLR